MFKTIRSRGFTLVEILIALAILGVLGATIYQAVSGSNDKSKSVAARDSLVELYKSLESFQRDANTLPTPTDDAGVALAHGKVGRLSTNGSISTYMSKQKIDSVGNVLINGTAIKYATDKNARWFAVGANVPTSDGRTVLAIETSYPVAKDEMTLLGVANNGDPTAAIAVTNPGTDSKKIGFGQITGANKFTVYKSDGTTYTGTTDNVVGTPASLAVDQQVLGTTAGTTNDVYLKAMPETY